MSTRTGPPERAGASLRALSPSAELPPLWVVLACEDNPRLCTGQRLVRLSLARGLRVGERPPAGAVLLDPHAQEPVTFHDAGAARARGLVAVDCSWNRLGARGDFPEGLRASLRALQHRRLPFLLAANPQHYGRVGELNTAEALGAAIFLTLGAAPAEAYFARLPGGPGFLRLNQGPLAEYRKAPDAPAVLEAERHYFP